MRFQTSVPRTTSKTTIANVVTPRLSPANVRKTMRVPSIVGLLLFFPKAYSLGSQIALPEGVLSARRDTTKLDHPEAAIAVMACREGARPRATLIWVTTGNEADPVRGCYHVLAVEKPGSAKTSKSAFLLGVSGGPPGDRTRDTLIKSQVLYH